MKRIVWAFAFIMSVSFPVFAGDGPAWIGAITREQSHLPEGNCFHTWSMTEEQAAMWENVDTLAKRSIILRKEFIADENVSSAVLNICGLGHYSLYLNGTEVAPESVFKPLWSEYSRTVYYNTFDVTGLLNNGPNAVGVMLGNGMFNVTGGRYVKFRHSYGPPQMTMWLDIVYSDGTSQRVQSDSSWKYSLSPIVFNCIFGGEDYDAREEQPGWNTPGFDDSSWCSVVMTEGPEGELVPQDAPMMKVSGTYGIAGHWSPSSGHHIFDMGQNLSGFPTVRVRGKRGQKICLVPAERISGDSLIVQSSSGSPYWFRYTMKGDGVEEWTPEFAFYGYRYIEVRGVSYGQDIIDGAPELIDLKSNFVHSSAASAGTFECSNTLFNRIHFIIDKAMRSNMHAVFTDCPHREKLGWLEETHLNGPGLLFNYDLTKVFPKIMRDIADSQHPDGLVPSIAPEYVVFQDGFADSPEWGSAAAILPWMYYEWYGDDSLIRSYYPVMKRYAGYLLGKSDGFILEYGLGDWCDYGPAPAGYSQNTPSGITATGHFYMVVDAVAKAAAMVGNDADAERYSMLRDSIATAFNNRFLDRAGCVYGNGSQCSYAIPLFIGIVPEECKGRVVENFIGSIRVNGGKLSTGDVGNRYLFQAMAMNGLDAMVYDMHNHYDVPGYGYQVKMGVTTLTEQWNPELGLSWNHFMMGQIEEWFYRSLGGINPDSEHPGFRHFYIRPAVVGDLDWVRCSYRSVHGLIRSEWQVNDGHFMMEVEIPEGTSATVVLPSGEERALGPGIHIINL